MKETCLEFSVVIKAGEPLLRNIHNRLVSAPQPHRPALNNVLANVIKDTLIAAGVDEEFTVELHPDRIIAHYDTGGGLNAQEWLEAEELKHHVAGDQDVQPPSYISGTLYSED